MLPVDDQQSNSHAKTGTHDTTPGDELPPDTDPYDQKPNGEAEEWPWATGRQRVSETRSRRVKTTGTGPEDKARDIETSQEVERDDKEGQEVEAKRRDTPYTSKDEDYSPRPSPQPPAPLPNDPAPPSPNYPEHL
ncbi:hypothetical protein PAXINDRAFT_16844 [Paxillus involutus ATCC 200175]|uniref:Uncharacterized protein n=1 Tax=Paxillus involutus ATCC 200175 TaxID=664439 RepID=A0A0C9THA7_PAXIN|nr:hypothetical protein PAXINDRAFT_16844 [Paxillus involutus ATCC 200175]